MAPSVSIPLFPGIFILGSRERCSGPFLPFQEPRTVFHGLSGMHSCWYILYRYRIPVFGHVAVAVAADVVAVERCMGTDYAFER